MSKKGLVGQITIQEALNKMYSKKWHERFSRHYGRKSNQYKGHLQSDLFRIDSNPSGSIVTMGKSLCNEG